MTSAVITIEHANLGEIVLLGFVLGLAALFVLARLIKARQDKLMPIDYEPFLVYMLYSLILLGVTCCLTVAAKISTGIIHWRAYTATK